MLYDHSPQPDTPSADIARIIEQARRRRAQVVLALVVRAYHRVIHALRIERHPTGRTGLGGRA